MEFIIGHRVYRRNLTNTVSLFMLTVLTMTVLYELLWYKGLNLWILESRQEQLVRHTDNMNVGCMVC